MKRIIVCLLSIVFLSIIFTNSVSAKLVYENGEMVLSLDSYTDDGKIKVYCLFERNYPDIQLVMELPKINISLPTLEFIGADDKFVNGSITYPNIDAITAGEFNLQYVFVPNDDKYETLTGYLKYYVYPEDSEKSKGKIEHDAEEILDEPTTPSLTATTVQLTSLASSFDININNKPIESVTYEWTSSDADIVEVNKKNGLIKAKKEGKAIITCEITYPDFTTQTLTSVVIVGYDENSPVLSENELELEVGDKFTINVENLDKGSKVSWKSSNKNIVKVSSTKGKVTAVGTGEAYVTCTITSPDKQVIVLRTNISVTEIE